MRPFFLLRVFIDIRALNVSTMENSMEESIKQTVRQVYSKIAQEKAPCGCGCTVTNDSYSVVKGWVPEADLGLGCGIPTEFAEIKEGDVVVDLGSGAGNDAFIARSIVGSSGRVIGIDMTGAMIEKARLNNEKMGYDNVEFRLGEIEHMPLEDGIADVVVSNCVLNLVPDKKGAFSEVFRILKTGGSFSISDIIIDGKLPERLMKSAEAYAACIGGAVSRDEYLGAIEAAGFRNVRIVKDKRISVGKETLRQFLSGEEIENLLNSKAGITSITVCGEK